MECMKKYKGIFMILIFIIAILIGTNVQADEYFYPKMYPKANEEWSFLPSRVDGHFIYYCIEHGNPYNVNLPAGYDENSTYGKWCPVCNPNGDPQPSEWDKARTTLRYNKQSTTVNDREYQDVAYVFANAKEAGKLEGDLTTQFSIWATSINSIPYKDTGAWGLEAVEYKKFYDSIHIHDSTNNSYQDIYSSKVKDKTNINNVTVQVDQQTKTYIVGPFKVEYPKGEYNGKKWSYITNITILDQVFWN